MHKVYCKNCKYYIPFWNNYTTEVCGSESEFYSNAIGDECVDARYCKAINKNYDCEYYERKWWKFWIKAKKGRLLTELENLPLRGPTL